MSSAEDRCESEEVRFRETQPLINRSPSPRLHLLSKSHRRFIGCEPPYLRARESKYWNSVSNDSQGGRHPTLPEAVLRDQKLGPNYPSLRPKISVLAAGASPSHPLWPLVGQSGWVEVSQKKLSSVQNWPTPCKPRTQPSPGGNTREQLGARAKGHHGPRCLYG